MTTTVVPRLPGPRPRPLPINLGVSHPFRPHPLEVARAQCSTCFGWRDDPRHW